MRTYKVELADDNFEIILCNNDNEAIQEAFELGEVMNIFEVDDNYDEIKMVW